MVDGNGDVVDDIIIMNLYYYYLWQCKWAF